MRVSSRLLFCVIFALAACGEKGETVGQDGESAFGTLSEAKQTRTGNNTQLAALCSAEGGTWDGESCIVEDPAPVEEPVEDPTPVEEPVEDPAPADESDCAALGGELCDGECVIFGDAYECTPCNQAEVCPSGSTSSTGPGVCIVDEGNVSHCEYLYMQPCETDADCDAFFDYDHYAICCPLLHQDRCLNPMLCR
jgi:hypothetical protein